MFHLPQTRVAASTYALHHNPEVFYSPDSFEPERWLNKSPEQLRVLETSFIPFGYGARICIGKNLAIMEIKILIACMFLRYSTAVDRALTTEESMWQTSTTEAVPIGLRCDVFVTPLSAKVES